MLIRNATFVKSSAALKDCPKPDRPEYAFIGRSNVGKSSLINMLCGRSALAKTSATPGKTRLINHFDIDSSWYLVDLPGYGYAKVPKTMLQTFEKTIFQYLTKRENLCCTFVLIDSRIAPQTIDLNFINRMGELQLPIALVFTKTDKTSRRERELHVREFQDALLQTWEELPKCFLSSTVEKTGKEEILGYVEECNEMYRIAQGINVEDQSRDLTKMVDKFTKTENHERNEAIS